jgi:hypothetical protein
MKHVGHSYVRVDERHGAGDSEYVQRLERPDSSAHAELTLTAQEKHADVIPSPTMPRIALANRVFHEVAGENRPKLRAGGAM